MPVALIGLTGGMGAGKSSALDALRALGATTLSADDVVHQLYGEQEVVAKVVQHLGEQVAPAGKIDRSAVAEAVFKDPERRQWLEQMLWPLVGKRITEWVQQARERQPPPKAAVLEVPLLFESGFDKVCDATIAIVADEQKIATRTSDRGLVGVGERVGRQLSQQQKAARATYVVRNDGDLAELEHELSRVLDNLCG